MKNIIMTIFASIGMTTVIFFLIRLSFWLSDLGNAFINKYKQPNKKNNK